MYGPLINRKYSDIGMYVAAESRVLINPPPVAKIETPVKLIEFETILDDALGPTISFFN